MWSKHQQLCKHKILKIMFYIKKLIKVLTGNLTPFRAFPILHFGHYSKVLSFDG